MLIVKPSSEDLAKFRSIAQPAGLQFISEKIGQQWVDKALAGAKAAEEKIGDRADAIVQETINYANAELAKIDK